MKFQIKEFMSMEISNGRKIHYTKFRLLIWCVRATVPSDFPNAILLPSLPREIYFAA